MESKRMEWPDWVKGFGILLMVVGHANVPYIVKTWIYGFHMPLFFFMSGYLFNREKWEKEGLKELLVSRAKSYLIPYVMFFTLSLLCQIFFDILGSRVTINKVLNYIFAGIYSYDTKMPNCDPLWFLTCIFVAYVFFWFLIMKSKNRLTFSLLIVCLWVVICRIERIVGIVELPWHIDVAMIASVFMMLGYYFKDLNKELIKCNQRIICIILVIFTILGSCIALANGRINMVQNVYQNKLAFIISACLLSFTVIYFFMSLENRSIRFKGDKLLSFFGKNTLYFMGINYIVNALVRFLLMHFGIAVGGWIYLLFDILCVMICGSILAITVKYIKRNVLEKVDKKKILISNKFKY